VKRVVVVVAAGLAMLAACGTRSSDRGDGAAEVEVVAAFAPLAEAAAKVGGGLVGVENLTPAGVEPHDLELSPRQVEALVDADVVVYLGDEFQPAVAKVAGRRDAGTVDVLDRLGVHGRDADPHVWLDPTRQADAADAIADVLAAVAPERESSFRANAASYRAELEELDRDLASGLADCDRREIVTSHAAFDSLARRYGLTQVAVTGRSPSAEPEAARLADLAEVIRDRNVTTVFAEELVSPKVAEALAREADVAVDVLDPIESLRPGDDYATAMRRNLAALRKALGCR
jgi:zinc transport system substrate-binding protein